MTQLAMKDLLFDTAPPKEKNPFHRREEVQHETPKVEHVAQPAPQVEEPVEAEIEEEIEVAAEEEAIEIAEPVEVPRTKIVKHEVARSEEARRDKLRKGRPRSEKSRVAILKATNALLLHTSVQELSIEAIAKKAKVGKTTIYRWWPNKTAVVMEALSTQPAMQEPMPTAQSNAEALRLQLKKLIRLLHSKNGETIAQLFSEAQANEESQKIFENSFLGPLLDAIEYSIEQGKKDGEFRNKVDSKLAIDLLCGPIFFRLMAHPANFNEEFEETFPKQAVGLITV
jgi:AcrR family transcriptional regulator